MLKFKILSSISKTRFSNSITVDFYVEDLENQAVNVMKHAWGWFSRWTEVLAPRQSEKNLWVGPQQMENESLQCCLHHGRGSTPGEVWVPGTLPYGPGAPSVGPGPVLAPVQHPGERPCPPASSAPGPRHRALATPPPATGLPNWLLALEHNVSFPLGHQPKHICSCGSWRSSNPPTTAFVQEQPPVTASEYTEFILSQCSQLKLLPTEKC